MNGNKIFLDTNAFIYFFKGRSKITDLVVNTPEIYFSASYLKLPLVSADTDFQKVP